MGGLICHLTDESLAVATWRQTSQTHKPKECKIAKNIIICRKKYLLFAWFVSLCKSRNFLLIKSFTLSYQKNIRLDWKGLLENYSLN